MKKIVFGITSLGSGGAERVLVDIVNKLCDKYDITIFSLYGDGCFVHELDKRVKFVSMYFEKYEDLSFMEKKKISLKLVIPAFRNHIYNKYIANKYDVEVAFLEGPITWIMSKKSNVRKLAWIHNDIESVFGSDKGVGFKKKLNKKSYLNYNELIFVSQSNLEKFESFFPNINVSKRVIYNYLNTDAVLRKSELSEASEIDKSKYSFVQVSRLVKQKAVLRLLDVHKRLINSGYDYNIYIVGDGPLRGEIEEKIREYNVTDSFHLLGQKDNPYPYIKECNAFILTSFYEGYPMVLLEARALNKYIMITDSAARETLSGYRRASMIVSNDEKGITKGLKRILDKKPSVSKNYGYDNKEILKQIIDVIEGDVLENIDSNSNL